MRRSILACGLLLALAGLCTTATAGPARSRVARHLVGQTASRRAATAYRARIQRFRRETWYWQRLMGFERTPARATRALASASPAYLRWSASLWHRRALRAHHRAQHPPNMSQWLCIHHYEGAWNDAGGPYYGGLQMSLSFQEHWGGWLLARKGTADHWTPLEQIWTASHAARLLGFYPWPNTARTCGLL